MSVSKLVLASSFVFGIAFGVNNDTINCTESITVTDVDFRQSVPCSHWNFPCDSLEGTYYFTGFDSQGTPTYTQPSTGAFFSVFIEPTNPVNGILASLAFTYDGNYFAPGWDHSADVVFIDDCDNIDTFEVQSGALLGSTNVIYFPRGASYPPLYITATLDDCIGVGLDNRDVTPAPTNEPTTKSPSHSPTISPTKYPTNTGECPNYDYTEYPDCYSDSNCLDCQPWGCASCKFGYYKMHNKMKCQNCVDNYPGCGVDSCDDWNGCVYCEIGTLLYSVECHDEVCQ